MRVCTLPPEIHSFIRNVLSILLFDYSSEVLLLYFKFKFTFLYKYPEVDFVCSGRVISHTYGKTLMNVSYLQYVCVNM